MHNKKGQFVLEQIFAKLEQLVWTLPTLEATNNSESTTVCMTHPRTSGSCVSSALLDYAGRE